MVSWHQPLGRVLRASGSIVLHTAEDDNTRTEKWPEPFMRQAILPEEITTALLECLKGTSFLFISAVREEEQRMLRHDAERHPCIPML
jgi:hypothetical protein